MRLGAPGTGNPGPSSPLPPGTGLPASPRAVTEQTPAAALPVGIPDFASVKDQVASGLKPLLDGLDWLRQNGFRTVLHVHRPGEDDAAERRQVEKRGLKFVSLEVSPQTLDTKTVSEFNRMVNDTAAYPLFVYDGDGVLAGGLWYLYFRTSEKATDEQARARAASLGLKPDRNGEAREMWLAIQKYLSNQKP